MGPQLVKGFPFPPYFRIPLGLRPFPRWGLLVKLPRFRVRKGVCLKMGPRMIAIWCGEAHLMADGWNGIAMDSQFSDKPSSVVHPGNSRLPSVFGCGQIHSPWRKKAMMWSFFYFHMCILSKAGMNFPVLGGLSCIHLGKKTKMGIPQPRWLAYFMVLIHLYTWMMTGGSPISGNPHILGSI